ncbi:MAG TPA: DNA-binding domain-containing protein [Terriglobales bacterium]|nr:DNA-binding domain-containing protein [Terriglobales bacterium]
MTGLALLQRSFAAVLRAGSAYNDAMADDAVTRVIAAMPGDLAASQRIGIYRNHHHLSLVAALATHYPSVRALIGADAFDQLALDFVTQSPPQDARLAYYGAGFTAFLASEARLNNLAYLGDVARLDWALIQAQVADDDRPVLAPDLAAFGENLSATRFRLHPAATLIRSHYPLLAIRHLALSAEWQAAEAVDLDTGGCDLLVLRQERSPAWLILDQEARTFLTALAMGIPLGDAATLVDAARLPLLMARYLLSGGFSLMQGRPD